MKALLFMSSVLLTSLSFTGCAGMAKYDSGYYYPCKALSTDVGCIYLSVKHTVSGWPEDHKPDGFDFMLTLPFVPVLILDLPFSFISDLVTFPYDLCHAGEKIPAREHEEEQPGAAGEKELPPGPGEEKQDEPPSPK